MHKREGAQIRDGFPPRGFTSHPLLPRPTRNGRLFDFEGVDAVWEEKVKRLLRKRNVWVGFFFNDDFQIMSGSMWVNDEKKMVKKNCARCAVGASSIVTGVLLNIF